MRKTIIKLLRLSSKINLFTKDETRAAIKLIRNKNKVYDDYYIKLN